MLFKSTVGITAHIFSPRRKSKCRVLVVLMKSDGNSCVTILKKGRKSALFSHLSKAAQSLREV